MSEIDFLVVSDVLLADFSLTVQWGVPWGTHAAPMGSSEVTEAEG